MNKLLFFCISSALLLFSIIVVNILPPFGEDWFDESCRSITDKKDYFEKKSLNDLGKITQAVKDEVIDIYKREKKVCDRKKAVIPLQYTAFNLNIIFGFICAFLGFLLYFDIKNIEITGIIGIGCGFIGFVITLVYIIESGLIFNDIDNYNNLRIDSDGANLEWTGSNYECIFYDSDNKYSLFRRYSDYGNKFLNYKKEVIYSDEDKNYEYLQCSSPLSSYSPNYGPNPGYSFGSSLNLNLGTINDNEVRQILTYNELCKNFKEKKLFSTLTTYMDDKGNKLGDCKKLYQFSYSDDYERKNLYDRWLTTIILSCFILLFNIGVAIFGFLIFNSSGHAKL